jgi:hypothetical protein
MRWCLGYLPVKRKEVMAMSLSLLMRVVSFFGTMIVKLRFHKGPKTCGGAPVHQTEAPFLIVTTLPSSANTPFPFEEYSFQLAIPERRPWTHPGLNPRRETRLCRYSLIAC